MFGLSIKIQAHYNGCVCLHVRVRVRTRTSVHWKFQLKGFMSSLNQSYRLSKAFARVLFIHHKERKHRHIPNSISTDLHEKNSDQKKVYGTASKTFRKCGKYLGT